MNTRIMQIALAMASVCVMGNSCQNNGGPQDNTLPPEPDPVLPVAASITSGDSFVGVWKVTDICAVPVLGVPKYHHEEGHGASTWGHVNDDSHYAIYEKSSGVGSTTYGLMISEEFADYNTPSKKALINWNSAELHFTAGDVHEPPGGDGCILPSAAVATLSTELTGGGSLKRPKFHPNSDHAVQIWLFKDSAGYISPVITFDHSGDGGPVHRGLIH